MKLNNIEKHANCELSIRFKLFKGRPTPTPGLFCKAHDAFLDWLPDEVAYQLIDEDHMPVELYVERKKKRKKSA